MFQQTVMFYLDTSKERLNDSLIIYSFQEFRKIMNHAAQVPSDIVTFDPSVRYLNRDLSLLDFHLRVLEQAVDPLNPVIEQLVFC
jgi:hypothetical protein